MENHLFTGITTCSLCLIRRPNEILLGRKMKKLVIGKWNGFGGRKEMGENIRATTAREAFEETGGKLGNGSGIIIQPENLQPVAILYFHNKYEDGASFIIKVVVCQVFIWSGRAVATDEMTTPTFFRLERLPFSQMAPGDRYWLPPVLDGKMVIGHIHYSPGQKSLLVPPEIEIVRYLEEAELED